MALTFLFLLVSELQGDKLGAKKMFTIYGRIISILIILSFLINLVLGVLISIDAMKQKREQVKTNPSLAKEENPVSSQNKSIEKPLESKFPNIEQVKINGDGQRNGKQIKN